MAAHGVSLFQVRQLQLEYGRLHGIQTAVITNDVVFILAQAAMVPESSDSFGNAQIIRDDSATVPARTEIFRRIETEACNIADRPDSAATVAGPVRLGRVFDDA